MLIISRDIATDVAVKSGSWNDPSVWESGSTPKSMCNVLIKDGVTISYDEKYDFLINTIRVDGKLTIGKHRDAYLKVDTIEVTGEFEIETHRSVDIEISSHSNINVSWDEKLLSRGIVIHGKATIKGIKKTPYLQFYPGTPVGAEHVSVRNDVGDWAVGDLVVITATNYDGYEWDGEKVSFLGNEDETRIISKIEDKNIYFDKPLKYARKWYPSGGFPHIANFSRNIMIRSEEGNRTPTHRRGHVMFMHTDNVDVRYCSFMHLGRTDKSRSATDIDLIEDPAFYSNVKGRYPVHFHRSGVNDLTTPTTCIGNAVYDTPGWGYVHHDSNAILHNNVCYGAQGAGFVAETGNETGSWTKNLSIFSKGLKNDTPKNAGEDPNNFDNGRTGSGFFFQGRMVKATDNIACSCNTGFAYFHRGRMEDKSKKIDGMIPVNADAFPMPEALGYQDTHPADIPILIFDKNEAYACRMGLYIEKENVIQNHDIHSRITNFTAWSVNIGGDISYVAHYIISGLFCVGKERSGYSRAHYGFRIGENANDISVIEPRFEGFEEGMRIVDGFNSPSFDESKKHITVFNPSFVDCEKDFTEKNNSFVISHSDNDRFDVNVTRYYEYLHKYVGPNSRRFSVFGSKQDGLGSIVVPSGVDTNDVTLAEIDNILKRDGYFTNKYGSKYCVVSDYYTDRLTGDIKKTDLIIKINNDAKIGDEYSYFKGVIDLGQSGKPNKFIYTDGFSVGPNDGKSDDLVIKGFTPPRNGIAAIKDGLISYKPDFDFVGFDSFKYWLSDKMGNLIEKNIQVKISEDNSVNS